MGAPVATRRALMLAVAATPLATAASAAAHPGADLLRLEQEHHALERSADALALDLSLLEEQVDAEAAPMPEVLRVTADDRAVWPHSAPWWTTYNADELREQLPRLQRHADSGASEGMRWALTRAREVVDASGAREADRVVRLASAGHPALQEAYDATVERLGSVVEQILTSPARTVAGLQVKARLLHKRLGGAPGDDADVEDRLTRALLSDVLALPETVS